MGNVPPVYGIDRSVYHNNSKCTERNNIERSNLRQGTGGKSLCQHCKSLNQGS